MKNIYYRGYIKNDLLSGLRDESYKLLGNFTTSRPVKRCNGDDTYFCVGTGTELTHLHPRIHIYPACIIHEDGVCHSERTRWLVSYSFPTCPVTMHGKLMNFSVRPIYLYNVWLASRSFQASSEHVVSQNAMTRARFIKACYQY